MFSDYTDKSNAARGSSQTHDVSMKMPSLSFDGDDADDMLINYNERFANATPAKFRDEDIDIVMTTLLSRRKPNAALVGDAGVGKTHIVEEIARRIAVGDASVPPRLRGATIYELPLQSLVAGASFAGQHEQRVDNIIKFASNPDNDAIIFIDEIHVLNTMYAAEQLKPALARGDMRVIGATTSGEYKSFNDNPAMRRRFARINIAELTVEQTVDVISTVIDDYLDHHGRMLTVDPKLHRSIVDLAEDALTGAHRPDSALTLLDRALGAGEMTRTDLVARGLLDESDRLPLRLGHFRHVAGQLSGAGATADDVDYDAFRDALDHIIGQKDAIAEVPTLLRRHDANLVASPSPTSMLFAGPSGVGKTETARLIATHFTGEPPIVLNMSEFVEPNSIARLIGSPPGYGHHDSAKEKPFDTLVTNPRRVILLDEIEKANRHVTRALLGMLDSGVMQMADGTEINFGSAVVIATTNAGADKLARGGGFGFGDTSGNDAEYVAGVLADYFDREFLGRFGSIIAFAPLTKDNYLDIINQAYQTMRADIVDRKPGFARNLPDTLDEDTAAHLADDSWVPAHGARPAIRVVRRHIENLLDI